ncbi:MAG TPA: Glu-tRNA(Gln) amidotransferase subunit GatE, partial [Candidatus Nanoarchaeia archaeon]|nr:Glu-tRNA(Gln) amidotransferase subunit GatE [Candidatus Nanoarchaeia archaeon]
MDYLKIGLKAGLEIHQQLDTGKLFCACPGYLRNEEPDFKVMRKLHAVAGESGEVDTAVAHEATLGRTFYYQGYNDTTCLIELDEEPPRLINEQALGEALKIALLLNCEIYPVTQIMRKTVIDGSNTSGFQRTVLLAHDGFVETSFGKVKIDTLCLEEDSARIIEKDEKSATYRLDRLGIPLVEIATAPVLDTPEKIKETALKLGEIIRACKVKRGIGTIRQDLNISIKGHERVEVKGFQEPGMMIDTVKKEIERQQ